MLTREVLVYDSKTDKFVTAGKLIMSDLPYPTVIADPPDNPTLKWLLTYELFNGVGKPRTPPTDNPKWFNGIDRVNGSLITVTRAV